MLERCATDVLRNSDYVTAPPEGFGFVVFHELLHLKFGDDPSVGHVSIAMGLGLYTPQTRSDSNGNEMIFLTTSDDDKSKEILDSFMKRDCIKEEGKKTTP